MKKIALTLAATALVSLAACSKPAPTVENTATDLKNIGAGLYLLIGLLEDSARMNIDPLVGRAFRGLLQPLCSDIERHAAALQSAVTREN